MSDFREFVQEKTNSTFHNQNVNSAIRIFETAPAGGLLEICERIAKHLGIDKADVDKALLKVWDELQAERLAER